MKHTIFVHVPKTGGTSIQNALKENQDGVEYTIQSANVPLPNKVSPIINFAHATLQWLVDGGAMTRERLEAWRVISIMRNPWARLVSGYWAQSHHSSDIIRTFIYNKGPTFQAFAEWVVESGELPPIDRGGVKQGQWANPQLEWYMLDDEYRIDTLLRTEHLDRDWKEVRSSLGLHTTTLGRANERRDRPSYRSFYTPRLRQLVGDFYAADIELGGYTF